MAPPKVKQPVCFVVSPIGENGSPERIHADWLLEGIIRPVFAAHYSDYKIIRADKMPAPGLIDIQIIEQLLDAELVIADITTLNPNVFYEIGVRHVVNKAIIHMCRVGDPIPFDIKLFRHITFSVATPQALEAAKVALKESLEATFADDFKVDNPVTRTRGMVKFEESATPGEKVLQDQMASFNARLALLERADNPISVAEALMRPAFKAARRFEPHRRPALRIAQDEIGIMVIAKLQSSRQLYEDGQRIMRTYFDSYAAAEEDEGSILYTVAYSEANLKAANDVAKQLDDMEYRVEIYSARRVE
ncbi:hypothetical protein [Rhizobium sp. SU303]|uniref:hypothetical protein n=1 Tax=Rhizobium sp. SU303 TaxID=3138065 RepID=UPI001E28A6F2|nr:hypothetical protein [Rhizobium leguminosarum]UFW79572.1 hypothetical protein RlegSU303_06475 [Rhizobium leguminosarum bv. viciae]